MSKSMNITQQVVTKIGVYIDEPVSIDEIEVDIEKNIMFTCRICYDEVLSSEVKML